MKKKFFIPLCALAAIFAACSNDDNPIADQSAQEIKLFVSNTSDNQLATRGGRPLYGSEALQDVDSVVVYIYKEDDKVVSYVKTIDNWERVATASATGKTHSLKLTGQDRLKKGTYKLKAYAYSNFGTATFDPGLPVKGNNLVKDTLVAKFTTDAEELFAGENTLVVVVGKGDNPIFTSGNIVELNRQVAGAFGYFQNIPAKVRDKETVKIRLVASAKNTEVQFLTNAKYQVNGKTPATAADAKFKDDKSAFVVYEANVQDWFTAGDSNKDGFLGNGDEDWESQLPSEGEGEGEGVNIREHTILVGSFLTPFARVENVNTFELQLLAADGTITKTWNVGIQPDPTKIPLDEKFQYGVYRNHLYGIGKKTLNNPEDPTNPGDGHIEEPIDLSRDQDIFIDINSNWDVIHSLELE